MYNSCVLFADHLNPLQLSALAHYLPPSHSRLCPFIIISFCSCTSSEAWKDYVSLTYSHKTGIVFLFLFLFENNRGCFHSETIQSTKVVGKGTPKWEQTKRGRFMFILCKATCLESKKSECREARSEECPDRGPRTIVGGHLLGSS